MPIEVKGCCVIPLLRTLRLCSTSDYASPIVGSDVLDACLPMANGIDYSVSVVMSMPKQIENKSVQ